MIRIALTLALFIGFWPSLHGQNVSWEIVPSFTGASVRSLATSSSGIYYAGTEHGLYRSDDLFAPWEYAGLDSLFVNDLAVQGRDTVFAGTYTGLYRSFDGGASWKAVLDAPGDIADIKSVGFLRDGRLLAACQQCLGEEFGLLVSGDYGETWTPVEGVHNVYDFVELSDGTVLISDYGREAGLQRLSPDLQQVTLLHERFGGASKLAVNSRDDVFLGALGVDEEDRVYLAGKILTYSTDRGASWQRVDFFDVPNRWGDSLVVVAPDLSTAKTGFRYAGELFDLTTGRDGRVLAGMDNEGVMRSVDAGSTWDSYNDGLTQLYLRLLLEAPEEVVYGFRKLTSHTTGVYASENGGRTWERRAVLDYVLLDVAVHPDGSLYGVYTGAGSPPYTPPWYEDYRYKGVVRSRDGGRTWNWVTGTSEMSMRAITVDGEGTLYAVAVEATPVDTLHFHLHPYEGTVFRSEDGGDTWSTRSMGLFCSGCRVNALATDTDGRIFAVTPRFVWGSADRGETWHRLLDAWSYGSWKDDISRGGTVNEVLVVSSGTLYAILSVQDARQTGRHLVLRSNNYGGVWQTVYTGERDVRVSNLTDDGFGTLFMFEAEQPVYSVDGGHQWTPFGGGLPPPLHGKKQLLAHSGGHLFASGVEGGGLFRTGERFPRLSGEPYASPGEPASSPMAYPNPLTWHTNVVFTLSEPADVSLHVYNTIGQKITSLVEDRFDPGTYRTVWDASNASNGMYYARLHTKRFTATLPLVVVR